MAGFDYDTGRSNNMMTAEATGKTTIGRWAKRHGVSARAATEIMRPIEAHHTGTGRRGKSRLTPVIASETEPTTEQLAAMRAWDHGERPLVQGWYTKWEKRYDGPRGRKRNVPILAVYCGDPAKAPHGLTTLSDENYVEAMKLAGRDMKAYATSFRQVK